MSNSQFYIKLVFDQKRHILHFFTCFWPKMNKNTDFLDFFGLF